MPPLDAETMALLNYLLSSQASLDPATQQLLGGLIAPNVNKYGELDIFGSDLQKSNLNQYQDIYGSLDDPMNALLSGMGSFGNAPTGGGVLGGGGLNPITTETVMETPATLQTRYMAQLFEQGQPGQRSVEGLIASKLVNGQDPSLIMTDLQAKLSNPEASGLDPGEAALFKNSLPQKDVLDVGGNPTGETTIDWNATRKWIEDKATPFQQEQGKLMGPNITQNAYGQYVALSEQPSEMMQYLQKLGLPDPRRQYGVDYAVESDPALAELMVSMGTKGQAFQEAQDAYKKYLKNNPIAQSMARQREGLTAKREQRYRDDMAAYVRSLAEQARQPTPAAPAAPRTESYEEGPPGWLGSLAGTVGGAVTGIPGNLNDAIARVAGRPVAPPGAPRTPTNVNLFPEPSSRPTPPPPPTMPGPGLMEQLLGRVQPGAPGTSYQLFKQMNANKKSAGEDMLAMVRAIAPGYGAMRAGRSPFKDAIMQRLQPIFAVGGANG